ncbi:septal ring lytic transglycosylase RlpA family protein [Ferrimonas gelatinilytica]|uniref:Endolytic peptidoglycan transglycosylase RlpA n=1 Tax=Ferrimonas gelatinilytica TaxID=1255257 RepID=A0ABP9S898_9GAMM
MKASKSVAGLALLTLWGCSSTPPPEPESRYQMKQDRPPAQAPDLSHLEPLQPRYEPLSRGGNRDYQVWGIHYEVLDSAEGYIKEGIASWYGAKFHGHLTSNGETYDMYSFSAAHRSLPLPTYARVTNLENDKSLIVRINDRGPFHPDREIDLSYAAAWHLGVLKSGTARVRVEAIHLAPEPTPRPPEPSETFYIQLAASTDRSNVDRLKRQIQGETSLPARVTLQDSLYKLQLGPFADRQESQRWLETLKASGYNQAFTVTAPTLSPAKSSAR